MRNYASFSVEEVHNGFIVRSRDTTVVFNTWKDVVEYMEEVIFVDKIWGGE